MLLSISTLRMACIGFSLGVASGAVSIGITVLLAPFLLLVATPLKVIRPLALALSIGWMWSAVHWYCAHQQAMPVSDEKQDVILVASVDQVYKSDQFKKLSITTDAGAQYQVSCYQCPYEFELGDRWQLNVRLKPIISFHNPQGFDYRAWMLAQGISAKGYVLNDSKENKHLGETPGTMKGVISESIPGQDYPILNALVFGERDYLAAWQKRILFDAGISHLFVVSGLHVGFVAMFVMLVASWVARTVLLLGGYSYQWVGVAMALLAAAVYAWASGFAVPALRACVMLILAWAFWFGPGKKSVLDAWLWAVVLVAVFYPLQFYMLGTWLSFSIVLALIVGFAGSGKASFGSALIKSQKLAFLMGSIVLILFDQYVSVSGILVNLVLIPVFTLIVLPLAFLSLLALSMGIEVGVGWVEQMMLWILQLLHEHRSWIDFWPNIHSDNKWLMLLGCVLLLLPRVFQLRILGASIALLALCLPSNTPVWGGFRLVMLDVGQGSSALIQTQHHSLLVDTGASFANGMSMADYVVLPFLRQQGIKQLDRLHITHEDDDHAGGLAQLKPRSVAIVGQSDCKEQRWSWDGVWFEQFQSPSHQHGNDGSCLLRVSAIDGASLLFTGDIEQNAESALLSSGHNLQASVLVVPHHGSKTSSSSAFIGRVAPSIALISAGTHSRYGHPHGQVVGRFVQESIKVLNTGSHGSVEVDFPPRQAAHIVSTYRPYHRIIE